MPLFTENPRRLILGNLLPALGLLGSSATQRAKRGPGCWQRFPSPFPFPPWVMSRINMHMSVPGDTKCHIVQILFVIGVTITLVTSCWARGVSFPPSVCCSKQPTTRRYFSRPYYYPLLQGRPGLWLPHTRNCFYSPSCREGLFSESGFPAYRVLGNPVGMKRAGAVGPRP